MDIDFHYYATYVAARFAGYGASQAMTIATSAQMIDENGRHVLIDAGVGMTTGARGVPDDFEIRAEPSGPALHTYRVQMTFQGLGDIGTSSNDTVASIWPVYHFLPGNFEPSTGLPSTEQPSDSIRDIERSGPPVCRSSRWNTRSFSAAEPVANIKKKFRWLCRPHSPMAIGLVNNATDMIHDPMSVVAEHELELYLVGVTMHVFIDTWAHQDFVGPASRAINGVSGTPSIGFMPSGPGELPTLSGTTDPASLATTTLTASTWKGTAQGYNWIVGHSITDSGTEEKNIYVGHGQVGHWPDHSALIWEYKPNWSKDAIKRANPIIYCDAFVHMVWAMYCMRTRKQYIPFDLSERNVSTMCTTLGITTERLRAVYTLFTKERNAWGTADSPEVPAAISDIWDRDIYSYGKKWQKAIREDFGFGDDAPLKDWMPGKSAWVVEALEAHKANQNLKGRSGNWYSVAQFTTLPFFRFNLAAKCHYRFVKQQLLVFNEVLIGEWADGAAYSDDLTFAKQASAAWLVNVLSSLGEVQRKTELRSLSEGMAVLISELMVSLEGAESWALQLRIVLAKLRDVEAAVDSRAKFTYGIRDGAKNEISTSVRGLVGEDALKRVKKLITELSAIEQPPTLTRGVPSSGGVPSVTLSSYTDWESRSSSFASSRSSDPDLMYLDSAYQHLMQWLGGARTLKADDTEAVARAQMVADGCDAWLESGKGAGGRREAVGKLRASLKPCLEWVAS